MNGLLKKAMRCPYCDKTTPIPIPEASVLTVNGKEKPGRARTRAVENACFSCSKANWACGVHTNGSMVAVLTMGAAIVA